MGIRIVVRSRGFNYGISDEWSELFHIVGDAVEGYSLFLFSLPVSLIFETLRRVGDLHRLRTLATNHPNLAHRHRQWSRLA